MLTQQTEASSRLEAKNHQLNLIIALFLPVTAITSAFGMNLDSGLATDRGLLFWLVLSASLIVGFIFFAFLQKKL